ncbi:Rsp5p-dependent ubiquitination, sorting of cargo proteins at the multivesicular body [Podila humilis]|nr:Rsp5p-dependent ubiquitination, sorting of cargo proteins at the multivesicular body [Podila humilis]
MPSRQEWERDNHPRQQRKALQIQQQQEYELWLQEQEEKTRLELKQEEHWSIPPSPSSPSSSLYIQDKNQNPTTGYPNNNNIFNIPYPTHHTIPQMPDDGNNGGGGEDEDITWLVVALLLTALLLLLASLLRSCSAKAGMWLHGNNNNNNPNNALFGGHRPGRPAGTSGAHGHTAGGGGRYAGSGPFQVPEDDEDEQTTHPSTAQLSETDERLALLTDTQRQAYDRARAFQAANPPGSVPTDISLSQFISIQEKGVSAWEFEPSFDSTMSVHDRTELIFPHDNQETSVQTNLPLPKQQEVYYWEVKMFEKNPNAVVSVGVSTKPYPVTRLPGWNKQSVAYFSKDGQKYCNSPFSGYPYGPIYFEGDVVGCGYRPRTGTIFFTRNGKRLEDAYTGMMRHNLFPTVGATGPCVLHVNFGQSGFVFVEANVKKWGLAPASGTLAPPPAYGRERGSILLEAGLASATPHTPAPLTRRPKLQSSQSRARIEAAGVLVQIDEASTSGNGGGSGGAGGGNTGSSAGGGKTAPIHISLSNMSAPTTGPASAPPPHYTSLDLKGAEAVVATTTIFTGAETTVQEENGRTSTDSEEEDDEARALIGGDATIERLSNKNGRKRSGTLNSVASGSGSRTSRR